MEAAREQVAPVEQKFIVEDQTSVTEHNGMEFDDDDARSADNFIWNEWSDVGQMNYPEFPPMVKAINLNLNEKFPIVAIRHIRDDCVRFRCFCDYC